MRVTKNSVLNRHMDIKRTLEPLGEIEDLAKEIRERNPNHVFLIGCGDSYFAAVSGRYAVENTSGLTTEAEEALEFARYRRVDESSLVVAISASGKTPRVLEACNYAKKQDAVIIGITDNEKSPLTEIAYKTIFTRIEERFGYPSSTSSAALAAIYALAMYLGRNRKHLSQEEFKRLEQQIVNLPKLMESTVYHPDNPRITMKAAKAFSKCSDFHFVGGGPGYGTALFGQVLLKELSWVHSEAVEVEEFCHYQMMILDEGKTPVIMIAQPGKSRTRTIQILKELKNMNIPTYTVCEENDSEMLNNSTYSVQMPKGLDEEFSTIQYMQPLHFLALHLAQEKKIRHEGFRYVETLSRLINLPDTL
nr:SIS domain-containing protein [Candidatus Freyarchaeota archaeon]